MFIQGTYTALITPFKPGTQEVDWDSLKKLVRFQLESRIEGIVPCGTTGESPTLSNREHHEVIAKVTEWAKEINPAIKIIAGAGSNSTRETISLTQFAESAGSDYALVVNPYYNKPTQKGLVKHFKSIAESSKLPLVLYNIPGRTSVSLSLETIIELSKHPNIVGIKEATGDLEFMAKIISETHEKFILLSGDDTLTLPILSIGGKGVISVVSNLFPYEIGEVSRNFLEGNYPKAKEYFYKTFDLSVKMFLETNPIPLKFAAKYLNLCENELRLPLSSLSEQYEEEIIESIRKFKGSL